MNIDELKQEMREQMEAPMMYQLTPHVKQMLLNNAPGCTLELDEAGCVVFVEPDGARTTMNTLYQDAETRDRIIREWKAGQ